MLTYAVGADPNDELAPADKGFALHAVCQNADGHVIGTPSLPNGQATGPSSLEVPSDFSTGSEAIGFTTSPSKSYPVVLKAWRS